MQDLKSSVEKQTLMQMHDLLELRYRQLTELSDLTERLNDKLNRTEGQDRGALIEQIKKEDDHRNIVELFALLAEKMMFQIDKISSFTEKSIMMIE